MNYDFLDFLARASDNVKTHTDFARFISVEIRAIQSDGVPASDLDKQLYLKRLNQAEFANRTGQIKDQDPYNEDLINFLSNLE